MQMSSLSIYHLMSNARSWNNCYIFYMDILKSHYRKSSTECLAISFCLYIPITFHNNLTEAKIANESITPVQSLNIQLSRVLIPGMHVWPNLGCYSQTFHVRLQFWSITRNEILLSSMLKVSSEEF